MTHEQERRQKSEVLLIGGCSGAGKTSVALALHHALSAGGVEHAVIEGDYLDLAWPIPHERGLRLAEQNLSAVWSAYTAAGYTRLIYTNTMCVRSDIAPTILRALGGQPTVHAVLLSASRGEINRRLSAREEGASLDEHITRSASAARRLDRETPPTALRVDTTNLAVVDIADRILASVDWQ